MLPWGILLTCFLSLGTHFIDVDPSPTMEFVYQENRWTLPLQKFGFDGIDPTTLNRKAFFHWVHDNLEQTINRPPRSAYFRKGQVVPHQQGQTVDRKKLDDWLDLVHFYVQQPVQVPIIYQQPKMTTSQLKRLKEKRLATYTTKFNPRNINRSHNIYLSAKAIDHFILFPGEIFSFNRVVGKRTTQRGYRYAPVIVKGEYSEGVGGGICQTSSTLFNSVDQAGLEIVERVSHSRRVTYVPEKRDATVSWEGPDFRFKNQLNEPVVIVTDAKGGRITVSIYGPKTILYSPRS